MQIENNIIKDYLKNCYFINGTAYAGKSTMCAMLAARYGMVHCGENYNMDRILEISTEENQPNLSYFRTKESWQAYLGRPPEEFERWFHANEEELAGFEVAELLRLSSGRRVIVDTNIPCRLLREISDYQHVAVLLSPQSLAVERFFDRDDPEKQFLLSEIQKSPEPRKLYENFLACIARVNSRENYDAFLNSGFFTLVREEGGADTREETLRALAVHFGLEA